MKIKLCDNSTVGGFDFFYFFLIVFYMAQMTPATSRMVTGLSSPWIPFLIPFVLTIALTVRHKVSLLDKKFLTLMFIFLIWVVAITISKKLYSLSELSFHFFLFYAFFAAYVHVRSFGKQIVPLFESVIVTLCKISLPFWILSLVLPGPMKSFAGLFPETNLGNNILFLYNYIDPLRSDPGQYLRNSGCSWEPGRFAIMITLAIFCNLLRNGVRFKGNYNVLWMMVTLLSTMSTTGYSIVIVMYAITILRKSRPVAKFGYSIVLIPLVAYLFTLDFMGAKIKDRLDVESYASEHLESMDYYQEEYGEDAAGVFDRFESMYFDWINFLHDPLFGYGRNEKHSFFREDTGVNFALSGGLVKVLAMYGAIWGFFIYILLFFSSRRINQIYGGTTNAMLFIVFLLSSVSYILFTIPIFSTFWLYEWFENKEIVEDDGEEDEEELLEA